MSGDWNQILVYEGALSDGESYSMRDIEIYTDQITGVEHLMVSVGTKGIFSGKYNPNNEYRIEMNSTPEIGPLGIRSLGIIVANNNLYFSSGNKLFKRNDDVQHE